MSGQKKENILHKGIAKKGKKVTLITNVILVCYYLILTSILSHYLVNYLVKHWR